MLQNNSTQPHNTLVKFYNGLISTLRFCIAHVRTHLLLFILCIFIATAAIYIKLNGIAQGHYKISFTVSYEELARKVYGDRLEKINTLISNHDYNKVVTYLHVDRTIAKNLLSVTGKNILGEDLTEDMNLEKIPFVITMTLKDTNNVTQLQNGIVNYLETGTPYLVNKKAIKMEEVDNEIAFIDKQLAMMDSLKRMYNNTSFTGNDAPPVAAGDDKALVSASSVYAFSYNLYKKRQELLRKKAMPNNLQIIDDAIVPEDAKVPLPLVLLVGIISGIVLYAFITGILIPIFRKES